MPTNSIVASTRAWDAREAGIELALKAFPRMQKPAFVLLFATIHYEKNGGFSNLLKSFYERCPSNVPLVGCTVAGFMTPDGCFTRGAAVMLVEASGLDVAIGYGTQTKRNPQAAARACAESIKTGLAGSRFPNKYFTLFMSSAIVPAMPIIGNKKVLPSSLLSKLLAKLSIPLGRIFQFGPGRDSEVVHEFAAQLPDFQGIGGAACDNLEMRKNYLFYNDKVLTNAVVALGIASEESATVNTSVGLRPSGKKIQVTTSSDNYVINKIDGVKAVPGYLSLMGWSRNVLDERLYRKVFYYPFVDPKNPLFEPRMFGLVYGDSFVCPMRLPDEKELEIYTFSGADLLSSISTLVGTTHSKAGFFISCGTRLETLGASVYQMLPTFASATDTFLVIYSAGEYSKTAAGTRCMYQSDNALLFT